MNIDELDKELTDSVIEDAEAFRDNHVCVSEYRGPVENCQPAACGAMG